MDPCPLGTGMPATLADILRTTKTIAIIGAKDTQGQPVDRVGRYLIQAGYTLFPVHPTRKNVWGLPTYERLEDISEKIDSIDVFRNAAYCEEHAKEALQLPSLPALFWMQTGIRNAAASAILAQAGVLVVEDACLMVEHAKIFTLPPLQNK